MFPLPIDDSRAALYTVGQVAAMLSVQQAFLRRLDEHDVVSPSRSPGGQRRYSRQEITLVQYVVQLTDEGMTLAAKQYAAARTDDTGRIVLSEFTGAATDLPEADIVNMNNRLAAADSSLNAPVAAESEGEWQDWLVDERDNAEILGDALGTLAGISLIFTGWSYVMVAMAARRLA